MAGESPDRSKQRESSDEATSGSAHPVPEAGGGTSDPRVTLARGTAGPADADPRGGVDTATRVITARDVAGARAAVKDAERDRDGDGNVGESGESGDGEERGERAEGDGSSATGAREKAAERRESAPRAGEAPSGAEGAGKAPQGPRTASGARSGGGAGAGSAAGEADAADTDGPGGSADGDAAAGAGRAPEGDEPSGDGPNSGFAKDTSGDRYVDRPTTTLTRRPASPEGGNSGDAKPSGGRAAQVDQPTTTLTRRPKSAAGPEAGPARGATDTPDVKDTPDATDAEDAKDAKGAKGASAAGTDGGKADDTPVDQPTTMLKLPPRGPRPSAAEPAGKPGRDAGKPSAAPRPGAAGPAAPSGGTASGTPATGTPASGVAASAAASAPGAAGTAPGTAGAGPDTGAADAASDRTSRFVALKSDMTAVVPQIGPERTTQQPVPPKPPLDLLAELTNTPPPPATPLRTLLRRIKIWSPVVLLLLIVFTVVQLLRPLPQPTLELSAEDTFTFEGGKPEIPWPGAGQAALDVQGIGTFGSSGDQKPVPIASVAKVMTAYLILRDHPLKSGEEGPKIKIDKAAQDQGDNAGQESAVKVTAGDSISEREALEGILIASANNIARLLARWDAGSEEAFVEKMNKAAEELGMKNTTYTDPSGLNDTTVSTAVDQVKLAKKAMEYPAFREVAAMMSYDDYKGVNHPNWNQLVGTNNVVGIKTGTTTSALGNLVFAAKKEVGGETRTIVGAVIRQPAGGVDNTILSAALTAGDKLIRAAQNALESTTIIKKGEVVGHVDDGLGGRTPVVATKDVTAVGWAGLTVKLTFAGDEVPHTAEAGTTIGTLTVGDASAGAVKVPVALKEDLVEPGFAAKLTRIS